MTGSDLPTMGERRLSRAEVSTRRDTAASSPAVFAAGELLRVDALLGGDDPIRVGAKDDDRGCWTAEIGRLAGGRGEVRGDDRSLLGLVAGESCREMSPVVSVDGPGCWFSISTVLASARRDGFSVAGESSRILFGGLSAVSSAPTAELLTPLDSLLLKRLSSLVRIASSAMGYFSAYARHASLCFLLFACREAFSSRELSSRASSRTMAADLDRPDDGSTLGARERDGDACFERVRGVDAGEFEVVFFPKG